MMLGRGGWSISDVDSNISYPISFFGGGGHGDDDGGWVGVFSGGGDGADDGGG